MPPDPPSICVHTIMFAKKDWLFLVLNGYLGYRQTEETVVMRKGIRAIITSAILTNHTLQLTT